MTGASWHPTFSPRSWPRSSLSCKDLDLDLDLAEFGWAKPHHRETLESLLLASRAKAAPWWSAALRACRAVALEPAELGDLRAVLDCARENPAARAIRPHPGAWPASPAP